MPRQRRAAGRQGGPQTARAFLVEAVILFAILAGCLAVVASVNAAARTTGTQADQLSRAVYLAQDQAEEFAAHPQQGVADATDAGLTARCSVEASPTGAGTLYRASITVNDAQGATVYTLATARYVGDGGR